MEIYPTDFHFPAFLQAIAEMCRLQAEQKNLKFSYEPDPELPLGVRADEKRLRQVLINLLSNGIKFTKTGEVIFKICRAENPEKFLDKTVNKIQFLIKDTGVGMSEEDLKKIFFPFEQVGSEKVRASGTGLGLAISQKIIQLMGSTIEVKSQPQMGSVFSFTLDLPLAQDWIDTSTQTEAGKIMGYAGERKTVMIIDDHWENRSIISKLLIPLGFTVMEAENGKQGLEVASQRKPDLVITDLLMPEMDGFQFIQAWKAIPELANIKVIASSASVFASDQHRSLDAGASDFLEKPVQSEELMAKVAKHLGIKWVYEQGDVEGVPAPVATTPVITPPPSAELEHFYQLALRGNLKEVIKYADHIEQLDMIYQPFSSQIRQFAKDFQEKKLLEWILQYRE